MSRLLPFSLLVFGSLSTLASALVIRSFESGRHLRFLGFVSNVRSNPDFYLSGHDFTGVGWSSHDPKKQLTLVTPKHLIGANHYRPPIGSTVRFLSESGAMVDRSVASIVAVPNDAGDPSDLMVITLDSAVGADEGISPLPYLNLATEAQYSSRELLVFGKLVRVGKATVGTFLDFGGDPLTGGAGINPTRTYSFSYNSLVGGGDDCHAEGGDSGSPSLAIEGGAPALVGTHTAVVSAAGTTTTYDSFVPHYAAAINAITGADGFHLTQSTPAPASLTLALEDDVDPVAAAGSVTYHLAVDNAGASEAHNLKLDLALPAGTVLEGFAGAGWVEGEGTGSSTLSLRRGGLEAGGASVVTVTLKMPPAAGVVTLSATLDADGATRQTASEETLVRASYASWSAGLADPSPGGDDDGDSVPNLLEFAFGGDPYTASLKTPSGHPLLPTVRWEDGGREVLLLGFLRRADPSSVGLSYTVEAATSPDGGGWVADGAGAGPYGALDEITAEPQPAQDGFVQVTVRITGPARPRFFSRVSVALEPTE